MFLLVLLVFTGVFIVLALLMIAGSADASEQTKRTLKTLGSALASGRTPVEDEVVDLHKQELLSAVPWLNRLLQKMEVVPRLRIMLYQARLNWTAGGVILMTIACFVIPAYLIHWRTGNTFFALLFGFLLATAPMVYVIQKRKKRFAKFEQELPETIDLIVSALRAGHSLVSALGIVAQDTPDPVGGEFRVCFEEQNYGLELRTAMENLVVRMPLQDLKIVVTAILIQKESGGNLAEVLDKTSYVIRERFRLKRQVRVHTAQGRLTGWILALLPPILGFALYLVNPKGMSVLWTTPLGLKMLYTSVVMTLIGALIIRKIVNMEV